MDLTKKALLVKATVHRFGNAVKDNESVMKTAEEYNIDPSMLDHKRHKFLKQDIAKINSIMGSVTPTVHNMTLPWRDGGWRLLVTDLYSKFEDKMRSLQNELEEEKQVLRSNYDIIKKNARTSLGEKYNDGDYPDIENLLSYYDIRVFYEPVPESKDIRVDMDKDVVEQLKQSMENNFKENIDNAMMEVWERVVGCISNIINRLKDYNEKIKKEKGRSKPRMFQSFVDNIKELTDLLKVINITDNPDLEKIRQKMEKEFAELTVEDIKESEAVRVKAIKSAESIAKDLDGIF